tara:strand:- start:315 stop:578 length:264 start_codon:yes stop_codon:yes gene_type:complete
MVELTTKVGITASAILVTRGQSMVDALLMFTVFLATIGSELFVRKLRLTMSRVMSLRNTPMVPSIVTARASSFARLASTWSRFNARI